MASSNLAHLQITSNFSVQLRQQGMAADVDPVERGGHCRLCMCSIKLLILNTKIIIKIKKSNIAIMVTNVANPACKKRSLLRQ